jgi:hypothetical protein
MLMTTMLRTPLQEFISMLDGQPIHIIIVDGAPWLRGKDALLGLKYKPDRKGAIDVHNIIKRFRDDEEIETCCSFEELCRRNVEASNPVLLLDEKLDLVNELIDARISVLYGRKRNRKNVSGSLYISENTFYVIASRRQKKGVARAIVAEEAETTSSEDEVKSAAEDVETAFSEDETELEITRRQTAERRLAAMQKQLMHAEEALALEVSRRQAVEQDAEQREAAGQDAERRLAAMQKRFMRAEQQHKAAEQDAERRLAAVQKQLKHTEKALKLEVMRREVAEHDAEQLRKVAEQQRKTAAMAYLYFDEARADM